MVPTLYATTFGNEASCSYHHSADGKVTAILKQFAGKLQGLPADPSAKCLQVGGSINEVVKRCNNLLHGIIRGNWQMKNLNTVFEYLIQTFQTLKEGGRAIAGYKIFTVMRMLHP